KANGAVLGAPGELLSRRYQVAVRGSNTPTVVAPGGVTGGPIGVSGGPGGVTGGPIGVSGGMTGVEATETVKVTASFCCGSKGSLTRTVNGYVPGELGIQMINPVAELMVAPAGALASR